MSETRFGNRYRPNKVCIDAYAEGVPEGRIYQYNSEFEDGVCFHGAIEFLKCMEWMMKAVNAPDCQDCRTFQQIDAIELNKPSNTVKRTGKKATFVVNILFRQHSSWQGTVLWCEKNKEISFRSVLELLLLMDSAVRGDE